ncbi:MAG: hypothetical protein JST92_23560 [Deltaproteobacteria bacterium]|nr:hypothetical protein [Deltaproteobacteria bacterium]
MRAGILIVCALVAAGCAKTYEEQGTFGCAEDHSCPEGWSCALLNGDGRCVPEEQCDPLDTSSCSGVTSEGHPRTRCTVMMTNPGLARAECVEQYGAAVEGTDCLMRFALNYSTTPIDFPLEDRFCADGTICHAYTLDNGQATALSEPTLSGKCRRLCGQDSECGAGQRCLDAFGKLMTSVTVNVTPRPGVCYPTCTLMPSGAGDCGVGEECQVSFDVAASTGMGVCLTPRAGGDGKVGDYCNTSYAPCGPGNSCLPNGGSFACQKLCRLSAGAAPCGTGKTCKATTLVLPDADLGFCG